MYRIMLVVDERDNFQSLYKFLTTNVDGEIVPVTLASREEIDAKVEELLNTGGYAKKDFIVVKVIDYSIDAKDYKM